MEKIVKYVNLLLVTVVCFLCCLVPFTMKQDSLQVCDLSYIYNDTQSTSYSFNSSDTYFFRLGGTTSVPTAGSNFSIINRYFSANANQYTWKYSFDISIYTDAQGVINYGMRVNAKNVYTTGASAIPYVGTATSYFGFTPFSSTPGLTQYLINSNYGYNIYSMPYKSTGFSTTYYTNIIFGIYTPNFDSYSIPTQVANVTISNYSQFNGPDVGNDNHWSNVKSSFGGYYNVVDYGFTNDLHLFFLIPSSTYSYDSSPEEYLSNRTYYYQVEVSDNDYYNNGYSQGLQDGKEEGIIQGKQQALQQVEQQKEIYRQQGYNDGLTAGSDYSFLALISAVIDAPINAFKSLFNFEILGFNILNFITGLFTLIVAIFIIRLILGGK